MMAVVGSGCGAQGKPPTTATPAGISTPTATSSRGPAEPASAEDFDPKNFTHSTEITNRYFPMVPGTQFLWKGHAFDDGEKVARAIEFTVTDLTKEIAGVKTVVAWDRDITDGRAEEIELTFYAQDDAGNVWYFGENSEEYDGRTLKKVATWLAGLHHATAGIMMPADPQPNTPTYAEGLGPEVGWSDLARIDQVGVRNCVETGCYDDVIVIEESSPDEPGRSQLKYYAPKIGGIRTGYRGQADPDKEKLQLASHKMLDQLALTDIREDVLEEEHRAYGYNSGGYGKTAKMEKR